MDQMRGGENARAPSRRSERLETRFVPATAGTQHTVVFVDADGTKAGSIVLHHGGPSGLWNCAETTIETTPGSRGRRA